jgi:tRNA threonylcarbamoyladenosine biosynthesis protein TsaB
MALILNIDTSSPVCSVCLAENGKVIAEHNEQSETRHASHLAAYIGGLIQRSGANISDLAAVAVSSGPGSYTGLRIGISVAKGICYAIDKPLIAVPTLQGLGYIMSISHPDPLGIYIPMLDARRQDVYMAIYDRKNNIIEKDNFATVNIDFIDNLARYNVKNIYFGGPGVKKTLLTDFNNKFGTVIENLICVASNITTISYNLFVSKGFKELTNFEPFYLKEFEGRIKAN